jgi:asparagine synthase (glutamine-hydrolysing)
MAPPEVAAEAGAARPGDAAAKRVSIGSWDRLAEFAPSRVRPVRAGVKLHRLAESMHHGSQETLYRQILSDWPRPDELVVGAQEPEGLLSDPV